MPTTPWTFRSVPEAAQLEDHPPVMPLEQAQEWCNFTVLSPTRLPDGCDTVVSTIRKEAPPGRRDGVTDGRTPWTAINPVAVRTEISGPGRGLRIKQFLYDWAFPALDHPCLWENPTTAHPLPDGAVVWHGIDYMGRTGASARLHRTLIETSVLSGEFSRDDIDELYRGLVPASPEAQRRIEATGFAALRYWARHPDAEAPAVPTGMWRLSRAKEHGAGDWTGDTAGPRAEHGLPAALAGYEAEAAAVYATPSGQREIDVVYTVRPRRDRELRLTVQRHGRGRLTVPPQPSTHPAQRAVVTIAGTQVHLAWIDEDHGPFDAVWHDPRTGTDRRLLSSTGIGMDREFFLGAVAGSVGG